MRRNQDSGLSMHIWNLSLVLVHSHVSVHIDMHNQHVYQYVACARALSLVTTPIPCDVTLENPTCSLDSSLCARWQTLVPQ